MSKSFVERELVNRALKRLNEEENKRVRKRVQRQEGQLLLLDNIKSFRKVIKDTFGDDLSPHQARAAIAAGKRKALELQRAYEAEDRERFDIVSSRVPLIFPGTKKELGKNVFIVKKFAGSISSVKDAIMESLIKTGAVTVEGSKVIRPQVHKGHGERGTAVAGVTIAQGAQVLIQEAGRQEIDSNKLFENFDLYARRARLDYKGRNEITQLLTKYTQILDPSGRLNSSYASVITFQEGRENSGVDAAREKRMLQVFRSFVEEELTPKLVNLKHSTSLKDKIEDWAVDSIARNVPGARKTKRKRVNRTSKGTVKSKKEPSSAGLTASMVSGGTQVTRATSRANKFNFSPLQLIKYMNSRLHDVVKSNMGSPGLNYQTGRFADSVRVVDINQTAKGYPSIVYTYQQNPYHVFEQNSGSRFASAERDPRPLIERSIREIAQEQAVGRFYTRRLG